VEGLIMLASTGAFIWLLYWLGTRRTRRARRAGRVVEAADLYRRVAELEVLAADNQERLNRVEEYLSAEEPLRRVQCRRRSRCRSGS
jgi:hypothetical protein